jgi:uncharacterized protein YbjT (DUF2867 family)
MVPPPAGGDAGIVLLTGATGYIGGRLLRRLEETGRCVRCLVRRPEVLAGRVGPRTRVVRGDLLDSSSLPRALEGVAAAYYLVHAMDAGGAFPDADRRAASNFAAAARAAGVRRIIYLGGLGEEPALSAHLASRQEVGRILRSSGVPTIELRASVVIGSGSASFEIVRALVEKLPFMLVPRWTETPAQPIAIEDALAYLLAALERDRDESVVFDIGGSDRVTYAGLLREYADQRGVRRAFLPVPLLAPALSVVWLGLVTPVYRTIARALVDSLRNETIVRDPSALEAFAIRPRGVHEAIARALANEDREFAETRWSDAISANEPRSWGGVKLGQRLVASRAIRVAAPPGQAFALLQRIGGDTGWYYANGFWRLRGLLDALVGGVGLRRGRRHPVDLRQGDVLDFWRVEAFRPGRLLRLAAEMRAPGRIWLQFEVDGDEHGSTIRQTAIFDPAGLVGLAYWYALYPIHSLIFDGMLRRIGQLAAGQPSGVPASGSKDRGLA